LLPGPCQYFSIPQESNPLCIDIITIEVGDLEVHAPLVALEPWWYDSSRDVLVKVAELPCLLLYGALEVVDALCLLVEVALSDVSSVGDGVDE
jgi:hypothetical protein